jgi:hypothetical protein
MTYGFRERHVADLHQEGKSIPSLAAPEAMVNLLFGVDRKRRGFFLVKGTGPDEVPPGFLQRDILGNQIDNIDPVSDFLDPVLGNVTLQNPIPFFKASSLI